MVAVSTRKLDFDVGRRFVRPLVCVLPVLFFAYACASSVRGRSPSDYWWANRTIFSGNQELAESPFADVRRVSVRNLSQVYTWNEVKSWSIRGDPLAAYAVANNILGVEFADELPRVEIGEDAAEFYYTAAISGCAYVSDPQAKIFLQCSSGLPEAMYAMGLFCEKRPNIIRYCSVSAQDWFKKSAAGGFYFAAAKIR